MILTICGVIVVALYIAVVLMTAPSRVNNPDSAQYVAMALGNDADAPYRTRVLVPTLWRVAGLKDEWPPKSWGVNLVIHAPCLLVPLTVWSLVYRAGGTDLQGFAAALVCVATPTVVLIWRVFPLMTDSWAVFFGLAAGLVDPWAACCMLVLCAMSKETVFVIASVWLLMSGMPLWLPAGGLVALILVRGAVRKLDGPAKPWFKVILRRVAKEKLPLFLDYEANLSSLKLIPVAMAVTATPREWVVLGLAWGQTLVAMDHSRLIGLAVPFILPTLVLTIPDPWLIVWMIASAWWPFQCRVL